MNWTLAVCVVGLAAVAGRADAAPITYTYTPAGPFNVEFGDDFTADLDGIITATATFNVQPVSTTVGADAASVIFSTTSVGNLLFDFPDISINSFTFDAAGNITDWSLRMKQQVVGSGSREEVRLFSTPVSVGANAGFDLAIIDGFLNRHAVQTLAPGTWAAESNAPAVPEPTSLALLAMGAVGLTGYRWRHGRRKQAA